MKAKSCFLVIFSLFFATVAVDMESESEYSGLVLEAEQPKTDVEDKEINFNLLDVQKFIGEAKTVVDKANNVIHKNNNLRRNFRYTHLAKFTDFIRHFIIILNKYNDSDLKQFFAIMDDELRKYHYRGCKFYELIDNDGLRRFLGNKLDEIKKMSATNIRNSLAAIGAKIEEENYDKNEKEFVDFINSIYMKNSIAKFNNTLINIENYRWHIRKNMDLVKILREGLRSIIFDHYTDLNTNAKIALKSKVDEFWNYVIGVSSLFVMKKYLRNVKFFNRNVVSPKDYFTTVKTTEELRTFRQMYMEKNLDLKYDPRAYDHLTTSELRKKQFPFEIQSSFKTTNAPGIIKQMYIKKDLGLKIPLIVEFARLNKKLHKSKIKHSDIIQRSALTTDNPSSLRQLYVKSTDIKKYSHAKSQSHNDKHSAQLKLPNKIKKTSKNKHRSNKRAKPSSMTKTNYVSTESQFNSQKKINSIEMRSRESKTSGVSKVKLLNKYKDSDIIKQKKPTVEMAIFKKMFRDPSYYRSENYTTMDLSDSEISNTDSHFIKSTDISSTPRQIYVELMELKYGLNNNSIYSTLFTNKPNLRAPAPAFVPEDIKAKTALRNQTKNRIGFIKAIKKNKIYLDLDSKLARKHVQRKTTKTHDKNRRLEKSMSAKYGKLIIDRSLAAKELEISGKRKDLKTDKMHTSRQTTTIEIETYHNPNLRINTAMTHRSRKMFENKNYKHKTILTNSSKSAPATKTITRQRLSLSFNKTLKPSVNPAKITKSTAIKGRKYFSATGLKLSEEGLSIEEFKNYRRMDNSPAESLLSDTAVITKIQQLENELNVVKNKLQNDTKVIDRLNDKICETENKLKDFCNQEFKIVRTYKNVSQDLDSDMGDGINDNEQLQKDAYNDFRKDEPKRFQVKRVLRSQYNEESNKLSVYNSSSNKDNKAIKRQIYKDIDKNTDNNRANSDIVRDGGSVKKTTITKNSNKNRPIQESENVEIYQTTNKVHEYRDEEPHNHIHKLSTDQSFQTYKHDIIESTRQNNNNDDYEYMDTDEGNNYVQAINRNDYSDGMELHDEKDMRYNSNVGQPRNSDQPFPKRTVEQKQANTLDKELMIKNSIEPVLERNSLGYPKNNEYVTKQTQTIPIENTTTADLTTIMQVLSPKHGLAVPSLIASQQANDVNVNSYKRNNDERQKNYENYKISTELTKDVHIYNKNTQLKGEETQSILKDKNFHKKGPIMASSKLNQEEMLGVLGASLATDVLVERWLNVTTPNVINTTPDTNSDYDNLFPEVDKVLGRIAKDKTNLAS